MERYEVALEIVKLESGDYIIRKVGDEVPLMTLNIADVVKSNLREQSEELARLMLLTGAKIMCDMSQNIDHLPERPASATLH